MKNITSLFARLALALTLATGTGAAMAAPISYHFTINTAKLAAGDGYLDLTFLNFTDSSAASAVISNFTGGANEATITSGSAFGNLSTTATLIGSNDNYVDQLIHFGSTINFDVLFNFADVGGTTTFAAQFYNLDFTQVIGGSPFATIVLVPGTGAELLTNFGFVSVTENAAAAVPEPGQWLLMLSGLLLMGTMVRRRNM